MGKINVALIGVGNCASSLIQGIHYYQDASPENPIPGIMHVNLGPYHINDIQIVAAFDIDINKVGKDLHEAIFSPPNCTYVFVTPEKLGVSGVKVERGMTHDGIGKYVAPLVKKAPGHTADIVNILKERQIDVVVNFLPVGSEEATKWYVEQVLQAGNCAFVNCIPVFIASDNGYWQKKFRQHGVPIIGDDIKSQVGSTIIHRLLAALMEERGVKIQQTYQLNFGGNTDFLNMLERERLDSKKKSKTQSVTSQMRHKLPDDRVHIGPSDYISWLSDRKWAYIRLEGQTFGDVPLNMELKLEVWDSPNSAGVVIDAIRCAKLALDRGLAGPLIAPSAYFMKSPPRQFHDVVARKILEDFIEGRESPELG